MGTLLVRRREMAMGTCKVETAKCGGTHRQLRRRRDLERSLAATVLKRRREVWCKVETAKCGGTRRQLRPRRVLERSLAATVLKRRRD